MAMMSIETRRTAAFGTMGTSAPMSPTTRRRRWNIGTRIEDCRKPPKEQGTMKIMPYIILGSVASVLLIGCRYARHNNSGSDVQLNVGERVVAIRYYEFGRPGDDEDYLEIDIQKKSLHYEIGRGLWAVSLGPKYDTVEVEAKFSRVCNDTEWQFVASNLNAMVVSEWKTRYANDNVMDGTFWRLKLCTGTNFEREYSGANAWPERFYYFRAIKRFIRNHPAFVAAYPEIAEKDREFKEWLERFRD